MKRIDEEKKAMIELYLPYPPSVNDYYGRNRNHVYLKSKGKDYQDEVRREVIEQKGDVMLDCNVKISIEVTFPKLKRKRDLDNLLKCTFDSLVYARVIEDDSLVDELNIKSVGVEGKGGLRVCIRSQRVASP